MDYEFEVVSRYQPIHHSEGNTNGNCPTDFQIQAKYSPSTKYHHLKANFYTDTLYIKVPSMLGNKLVQVFISGDFILVASMRSKEYGGIGLMDICGNHGIT